MNRQAEIRRLKRTRPRNWFVRISFGLFAAIIVVAYAWGGLNLWDLGSERRVENLKRFAGEVVPYPARDSDSPVSESAQWAWDLFKRRGREASVTTIAIAIAAIVLGGFAGLVSSFAAARNLATAEPFSPAHASDRGAANRFWSMFVALVRLGLIFARAIPEYIWAFIFLAIFGPTAWPAVLALAVHNAGILGKLGAETIENADLAVPIALRGLGASRAQIAMTGLFPAVLPRFLLYFFYRWETCVREATVLGMLGFTSLGLWIQDARARDHYDEMIFYILLGTLLVLAGDLASALTRRFVRRAA